MPIFYPDMNYLCDNHWPHKLFNQTDADSSYKKAHILKKRINEIH